MTILVQPDLFTVRETAVLSRAGEDRIRRELEHDVIEPAKVEMVGTARRLFFGEAGVLYFAMLHSLSGDVELAPEVRRRAFRLLNRSSTGTPVIAFGDRNARRAWLERLVRDWRDTVNRLISIDWDALLDASAPRIDLYRAGRARICSSEAILGGEPVFKGTRLAVRHIGGMRLQGEPVEEIVEDYPYLSSGDIEFAALYTEAHPVVGRPKATGAGGLL